MPDPLAILAEAADWYYDVAGLHEDEDLDPGDHLEVVRRAFASSDCDDFSFILSKMTEWKCVRASWQIPDWGFGHHSLVMAPDGRLLDVTGWTDEAELSKRYGGRKGVKVTLAEAEATPSIGFDNYDETGIESGMARIAGVIRCLPYSPFCDDWFREMTLRPLEGADFAARLRP